jgi:hypothetical protein
LPVAATVFLVYFGYPQAHEDDGERAVRAGLELIHTVRGLKSSVPIVRLGNPLQSSPTTACKPVWGLPPGWS